MSAPLLLHADDQLSSLPLGVAAGLGCRRPVVTRDRATGRLVHGRCYSRAFASCPSCAGLIWGDRRAQLLEGLASAGGRVAFVTLTAPSFGQVHRAEMGGRSQASALLHSRPAYAQCGCGRRHSSSSALVGTPLNADAYRYRQQVAWNSSVGPLWTLTLSALRRSALGRRGGDLPAVRVLEWQTRLAVHVHAILLLGDLDIDAASVRRICSSVAVTEASSAVFRWGRQIDVALLPTQSPQWTRERRIVSSYLGKTAGYLLKDRFIADRSIEDQRVEDVQARRIFETRLSAAAQRLPQISHRARENLGLAAQVFRASNSWPAPTLVERRRERAAYGRARAQAEGRLRDSDVEWPSDAGPRFRFEGTPDLHTVGDVLRFHASAHP